MPVKQGGTFLPEGLAPVTSKVGRLVKVGSKVRIWLDEEFSNLCSGGGSLNSASATPFGPLIQNGSPSTWADKLWLEQVNSLADEMDAIYTKITSDFGPISDVDNSGHVEIFMSPTVNRSYFVRYETNSPDNFRVQTIYRPEDLAYFNPETNPMSNEGEIAYMWVPDPAGIYNYVQFPSSNSISSNYAKGFLASQLFTMIVTNERMLVAKSAMEKRWLVEGLGRLVSSYYAGNDYAFHSLTQFLTSRSNTLQLDDYKPLVTEKYKNMALDESVGFRTMFAWYLHSRLCPDSGIAPCLKIKEIIKSKLTGTGTLKELLNEEFKVTLANAGLTIGLGLMSNRSAVLKKWDDPALVPNLPPKPFNMPNLTEVNSSSPPKTVEEDSTGVLLGSQPTNDRTQAGPYPSREMFLFHLLAADNDLQLKLAKNSITYILVSGLVESPTDVTGFLGKGIDLVFLPAGDFDGDKRRIHYEKVSEDAHGDTRTLNLTDSQDPHQTNYNTPSYDSLDYSVTPKRQVWTLGSIDNFEVNIDGARTKVGDDDSYAYQIKPCEGKTGGDLTTCQGESHTVMVQVIVRDFDKELDPMLVVTKPDREIFRGYSIYGDGPRYFPDYFDDNPGTLCQSASEFSLGDVTFTNTNQVNVVGHGLTSGDNIVFKSDENDNSLPGAFLPNKSYSATVIDADNFTVNTPDVYQVDGDPVSSITFANPGVFTLAAHGYSTDDPVVLTVPTSATSYIRMLEGFADGVTYFAEVIDPNTFTLKAAAGANPSISTLYSGTKHTLHAGAVNECANGGFVGHNIFSDLMTQVDNTAYAHNYSNYQSMGPQGFPYDTRNTLAWDEASSCEGFRCFREAEASRQYMNFAFVPDFEVVQHEFYAAPLKLPDPEDENIEYLSEEDMSELLEIKQRMDSDSCDPDTPLDIDHPFVTDICAGFAELTSADCINVCGSDPTKSTFTTTQAAITNFLANKYVQCTGTCGNEFKATWQGKYTDSWVSPSHVFYVVPTSQSYYTYSPAIEPIPDFTNTDNYCLGMPNFGTTRLSPACDLFEAPAAIKDIRENFNVASSRIDYGDCDFNTSKDVCFDSLSKSLELKPNDEYKFRTITQKLSTDRNLQRSMSIASRAGELVAKPERLFMSKVDVTGNDSVINVIVGGRRGTQGQYILRVRLKNYD
jgi:hypothetical protein